MLDVTESARANLERAFPSAVRADATRVIAALPSSPLRPSAAFVVHFDSEQLQIPCRVYHPEPLVASLRYVFSSTKRLVLHCLYTRHHDGFVRQKHLESVLADPRPWTAPFVLQLLGEYVAEIHVALHQNQRIVTSAPYLRFCTQNPAFVERTKRRIVSYWSCYYRWANHDAHLVYRRLDEYPAYLVASALGWWSPNDLPRVRAR